MKKISIILFIIILLAGCGSKEEETVQVESYQNDKTKEVTKQEEDISEEVEEVADQDEQASVEKETLTSVDDIQEAIEYAGLGEGDALEDLAFENGEITAVIKIEDETFTPEQMAVTRYSQVSDYLLEFEGWEILTIEYVYVGKISFNRDQSEKNEYGMEYFPTLEIENQIKGQ